MTNFKLNPSFLAGPFQKLIGTAIVFCFLLQQGFSQTYTIGGVNYTPCGNTETVVAPFNNPSGALTTNLYSGMVRLTVSGTGASLGSTPGDAFYIGIPGNPEHDPNHYQLVTTKQGDVVVKNNDDAYRHIVYDIDAGTATSTPYLPPYRSDNTYSFIIDMSTITPFNLNPFQLRLGVNDGNYGDNFCSGCTNNYTVQVTQLCAPPPCDDDDNDGFCNEDDNCPSTANANQADADSDGTGDVCDGCPGDPDKIAAGQCGCGVADTDDDGDGTANCNDACPSDANKTEPGVCGCGVADTDTDSDGTEDCLDNCPFDANKTEPGQCGCGNADTDNDGDAVADCVDADDDNDGCLDVNDSNPLVYSADDDCDGVHNDCDVCPGGDDSGPCYASSFPGFGNIPPAWICGNNNNKVKICHNGNTLCISPNAVQAHLNHGDFLGPCTSCGGQNLIMPGGTGNVAAMAEQQELEIFPNPAASEAAIHLHGFDPAAAVELTVLDVSGKIVWQQTLEEGQHQLTLDLSTGGFVSGIYMVKANAGDQLLTKRLVVSK